MSEPETSLPSRAAIMSVIGTLEGLRTAAAPAATAVPAAPSQAPEVQTTAPDQAAQARHDQDAAALRDMAAERDLWRAEAQSLQAALTQQLEALRLAADQHRASMAALCGEVEQQRAQLDTLRVEAQTRDGQTAHLTAAMTALIELAHAREAALIELVHAREAALPPDPVAAATCAPARRAVLPTTADVPRTQPAPRPVNPDAPPMAIPSLAPDRRPPAKDKPRLGVQRVTLVAAPVAAPEPDLVPAQTALPLPLPPVVEFVALEAAGGGLEILPGSETREKKRRLHRG
jgi:hypothetical protein